MRKYRQIQERKEEFSIEKLCELIIKTQAKYPDLKERIFGAMQRLPLPEWEPKGRYKRPKDENWDGIKTTFFGKTFSKRW